MDVKFIKICGLKDPKQAEEIAKLGATHIGVIHFPKSPRHLNFDDIKKIKNAVSGDVKVVAVVVNPDLDTVKRLLKIVDVIQFHGEESVDFISKFPLEKIIKAFRIKSKEDIDRISLYAKLDIPILIDAYEEGKYGGTGKKINPELSKIITRYFDKVILSGGLSDENVQELINIVKPYGVDASSKLEIKPGFKDIEKVKKFIQLVKDGDKI